MGGGGRAERREGGEEGGGRGGEDKSNENVYVRGERERAHIGSSLQQVLDHGQVVDLDGNVEEDARAQGWGGGGEGGGVSGGVGGDCRRASPAGWLAELDVI